GRPNRGAEDPIQWGESRGDPREALTPRARARQLTPQATGAHLQGLAHGGLSVFVSSSFSRRRQRNGSSWGGAGGAGADRRAAVGRMWKLAGLLVVALGLPASGAVASATSGGAAMVKPKPVHSIVPANSTAST